MCALNSQMNGLYMTLLCPDHVTLCYLGDRAPDSPHSSRDGSVTPTNEELEEMLDEPHTPKHVSIIVCIHGLAERLMLKCTMRKVS